MVENGVRQADSASREAQGRLQTLYFAISASRLFGAAGAAAGSFFEVEDMARSGTAPIC